MLNELTFDWIGQLSFAQLIYNMIIGLLLAIILSWHYKRFGSTLSNREELATVLPFVLLTTILIISVVKSSLALSLGLVGALSIVRFRTPIKEPEELAYLFLAIAIGLGLGASQTAPTIIASLLILSVMAYLGQQRHRSQNRNLFLSIEIDIAKEKNGEHYLNRLNRLIENHVEHVDLRRFDIGESTLEAVPLVDVSSVDVLDSLINGLRNDLPPIKISFLDDKNIRNF